MPAATRFAPSRRANSPFRRIDLRILRCLSYDEGSSRREKSCLCSSVAQWQSIRLLTGGVEPPMFGIDSMPKDMTEQFLKRIIAVETGQTTNKIEPLSSDGKVWHVAIPTRKESK